MIGKLLGNQDRAHHTLLVSARRTAMDGVVFNVMERRGKQGLPLEISGVCCFLENQPVTSGSSTNSVLLSNNHI